jgi:hypothetical protein
MVGKSKGGRSESAAPRGAETERNCGGQAGLLTHLEEVDLAVEDL